MKFPQGKPYELKGSRTVWERGIPWKGGTFVSFSKWAQEKETFARKFMFAIKSLTFQKFVSSLAFQSSNQKTPGRMKDWF